MRKRYKLTLDVTLNNVKEEDEKNIEANLHYIISHAMGEGMVTGAVVHAEVESHIVRLTELNPQQGEVVKRQGELELLKDGNVRGIVRLNVADFTEEEPMLEKYMDLLAEKLTGSTLLMDIRDQVVDIEDGAVLVVEVEGDPSMIEDGPVAELMKEAS